MGKQLVLILGGVRSGKSAFAERLAGGWSEQVAYLATAQPVDGEMCARIAAHRRRRPRTWFTLEAQTTVPEAIRAAGHRAEVLLVDCLTNFLANLMMSPHLTAEADPPPEKLATYLAVVQEAVADLLEAYREVPASLIVVSNEVGQGVVPPYALGRVFRDALGWANTTLAEAADTVYWLIAGLPLAIKQEGKLRFKPADG
ncbi:MAG TPA: bifunctional adenosylcobinamide kinase/adenosylcobinamide-phosphate guanylyltransferase [Armatimonadetes bacterium]|nr:bifunctional adenosylcobinamide kinase/adenosylcobinamide-phosphate guanylyltransferase [Armatimonadota bacterium]